MTSVREVSVTEAEQVWTQWLSMWNEEPSVARRIVSTERFSLHLPDATATIDPSLIRGGIDLEDWVRSFSARFDNLRYQTDFGPLIDGDRFAFRWTGTARWTGRTGWPLDVPGSNVLFVGVDIFRLDAEGLIIECWSQGAVTSSV